MAKEKAEPVNRLFYGDNIKILSDHIPDESVDLIYLDPPFNSSRSYNVLFKTKTGEDSPAQITAFDDSWTWSQDSGDAYVEILLRGGKLGKVIEAMQALLGTANGGNDLLAYLVMITSRLIELHRTLKPTGSLYLHCDATASHYLKIILDALFGAQNFRNEIIWKRTASKGLQTVRLARNHDVILAYQKTSDAKWNIDAAYLPYDEHNLDEKTASKYSQRDPDGRRYQLSDLTNPNHDRPNLTYEFLGITKVWRWTKERMQAAYEAGIVVQPKPGGVPRMKRYLDEQKGKPFGDVWSDIAPINSQAAERLGYPTQKPLALLERIIAVSSSEGDVVLDPFCGCGTTVDAAQKLKRHWIGIDITYLAVDLIEKRLRNTYGESITNEYVVHGVPKDLSGAKALFAKNPFDFERWAVSLVDGTPNEKQVGDKGSDGTIRFHLDRADKFARVVVSVKGGEQINPAMVRDLIGTMRNERVEMGALILMKKPTKGMVATAKRPGIYQHPLTKRSYPKVQIITVEELLSGKKLNMPIAVLPYVRARPHSKEQLNLI